MVFEDPGEGAPMLQRRHCGHVDSVEQRSGRNGAHTFLQLPERPLDQRLPSVSISPSNGFVQRSSLPCCLLGGPGRPAPIFAQHLVAVGIDFIIGTRPQQDVLSLAIPWLEPPSPSSHAGG